jgi:hypothetical protein
LDKNIRISDLQVILDKYFGHAEWQHLEPETILIELKCHEYLVAEKIYILKVLNVDFNRALSSPEFLLWCTSVTNNEYAEFETIDLPTCLELAWCLHEARRVAMLSKQVFKASEELIDIVSYLLTSEGFSHAPSPFEFVPEGRLHAGQTDNDMKMKDMAIQGYLKYMKNPNSYIIQPEAEVENSEFTE